MRILLVLAVIVVFGALLVLDTAALLRLTAYCIMGGCGVRPMWIALCGSGLVLGAWLLLRSSPANVKVARVRKPASPRPSRGKATARGKPKRAKPS